MQVDWANLPAIVWTFVAGAAFGGFITNLKGAVELWRMVFPSKARPKIVVQSTLYSHADAGANVITITNLGDRVALLSYWEIIRRKRGLLGAVEENIADIDDGPTKRIETDSETQLVFADDRWFNPWRRDRPGYEVVFRYIITGDKKREVVLTKNR